VTVKRPVALVLLLACACERKSPPRADAVVVVDAGARPSATAEEVEVPEVRIRADAETSIHVAWLTVPGTAINDEAPFRIRWNRSDGLAEAPTDVKATGSTVRNGFDVKVRPMAGAPNATVTGDIDVVVCDAVNHSICLPVHRSVQLGFIVAKDAATAARVSIPLPAVR
jgi:hypothetical protein